MRFCDFVGNNMYEQPMLARSQTTAAWNKSKSKT